MSFVNALKRAAEKSATSPTKVYKQANTSNSAPALNGKAIQKGEARSLADAMTFRQMYILSRPK